MPLRFHEGSGSEARRNPGALRGTKTKPGSHGGLEERPDVDAYRVRSAFRTRVIAGASVGFASRAFSKSSLAAGPMATSAAKAAHLTLSRVPTWGIGVSGRAVHRVLGRPVDVVEMDASRMMMLGVAYQLRDLARILVGSEALEQGEGWPHATVLDKRVARPAMRPLELTAAVVRCSAEVSGAEGLDITQSAIDLEKLDDLVGAVDRLAGVLLAAREPQGRALAARSSRGG